MITIDFETEAIAGNPLIDTPKPVGVSIKLGDAPSRYYGWGHPTGNNSTLEEATRELCRVRALSAPVLFHNAGFDHESIIRNFFGFTWPRHLVNDTIWALFLVDPYAKTLSLKPSAELHLGLPPTEQDDVRDWILANVKAATIRNFGAHICKATGDLVGPYAEGDTDRTYALWQHLSPILERNGMGGAYAREQSLLPILAESSRGGVRVERGRLAADIVKYRQAQEASRQYIVSRIGEVELSKDAQVADALERTGLVSEWKLTATGKRSVSRKNLLGAIADKELMAHLSYYGALETCLATFAEPWLAMSERSGRLHPEWHQTRGEGGGARTGRMSCSNPNLTNVPNDFEGMLIPPGQPPMIQMRDYLLPEEGHVWLKRDFSAQEMRIMAHFAEGRLFDAFNRDPETDPHTEVQAVIKEATGKLLPRKSIKVLSFGIIYGMGIPAMAATLGVSEEEAREAKEAYFTALPEARELAQATKRRGSSGQFIRTWGGRCYLREPNADRDMSYKLLNYLIQGSAADQTKQAIVDWDTDATSEVKLLAAVHDEINVSAPLEFAEVAMDDLKFAMEKDRFDVPFRSQGFRGATWAEVEPWEAS